MFDRTTYDAPEAPLSLSPSARCTIPTFVSSRRNILFAIRVTTFCAFDAVSLNQPWKKLQFCDKINFTKRFVRHQKIYVYRNVDKYCLSLSRINIYRDCICVPLKIEFNGTVSACVRQLSRCAYIYRVGSRNVYLIHLIN